MTVFAYSFPLHTAVRVWDSFLKEGWKVPLRVTLAILKEYGNELLACKGFEDTMLLFKRIPGEALAREPWRLLRIGFSIRFLAWRRCAELLAEEAWLRESGREGEVGGYTAGTIFSTIPHNDRLRLLENLPEAPGKEGEEEEEEEGGGGGEEGEEGGEKGKGGP